MILLIEYWNVLGVLAGEGLFCKVIGKQVEILREPVTVSGFVFNSLR